MKILPFPSVQREEWDALVEASPDGWPVAFTAWRQLILSVPEWQLQDHSFAIAEGSRLLAVVPLQFDPRDCRLSSSGWGGCGPIIAREITGIKRDRVLGAAIHHMELIAKDVGAIWLGFSISPVTESSFNNIRGVNPFVFYGFDDVSGISQLIDLTIDEEKLWRGLSETARQTIRKAQTRGYQVERGHWSALADDYVRVHRETYHRTGISPHPRAYFDGIAREAAKHHALWVVRDSAGSPIAFHNDMCFKIGAWYHTGCSTADALRDGVNYLLFWEAIRGAKAAGHLWYDCGEIFPATTVPKLKGLTLFKTRFGGTPHRFIKCSCTIVSEARSTAVNHDLGKSERSNQWFQSKRRWLFPRNSYFIKKKVIQVWRRLICRNT